MAKEITDENIEEILKENEITVIDFWAEWCGPCRMVGPIIEELSKDNEDVTIGKVNVDGNRDASSAYGVRSIPTIIFFKDGKEVDRVVGMQTQEMLQLKIEGLK